MTDQTDQTEPETVWLAIDLFPESMEVLVAADRDGALAAIKSTIAAEEWQSFQDSLTRNNEPGADLTLDAPAVEVLEHYWGEFEDTADEHGVGAVFIGEYWLVRPAQVQPRS